MLKDDFKVIQIVFAEHIELKKYTKTETIKNVLVEIKLKWNLNENKKCLGN